MLPIERQNRIKQLVKSKGSLKISELSKELGVSEMTIHRDVKPLLAEGIITKTFGGIALVPEVDAEDISAGVTACVFCGQFVTERLAYRLILQTGEIEQACCAHCGLLRHHQLGNEVMQAICHDFLRQTTISALNAYYVMDTTVNIGCCQPQVLTFELREHGERFVKGFGGIIYSFQEATAAVHQQMEQNEQSHCERCDT